MLNLLRGKLEGREWREGGGGGDGGGEKMGSELGG